MKVSGFAIPKPPRSLSADLVKMQNLPRTFCLTFGGIWFVVGILVTLIFVVVFGNPLDDSLDRGAIDGSAIVSSVKPFAYNRSQGPISWSVNYRYKVGSRDYDGYSVIHNRQRAKSLRKGDKVEIVYHPKNVENSLIKGGTKSGFPMFAYLLPLGFSAFGLLVFIIGLTLGKRHTIYSDGHTTVGIITKVEIVPPTVHYHYRDGVQTKEGWAAITKPEFMEDPNKPGEEIDLLYLPGTNKSIPWVFSPMAK